MPWVALLALAGVASASAELLPGAPAATALRGDDECGAGAPASSCALSALQRRASRPGESPLLGSLPGPRARARRGGPEEPEEPEQAAEAVADGAALGARGGLVVDAYAPPFSAERVRCGQMDDSVDYTAALVGTIYNVGSEHMCCAACAGHPTCEAWTWGKRMNVDGLTHVCWLKELDGQAPVKMPNENVVSGLPAKGVKKYGVVPPPPSRSLKMDGVVQKSKDAKPATAKCLGSLQVEGLGTISLINAGMNTPTTPAGPVEVIAGDLVTPHMTGRAYFGTTCTEGQYDQSQYAKVDLLGKTMSWTTDVSGTGCGCNAALYLTSMAHSSSPGACKGDFYCDAMEVCGAACAEIDLQEANQYSWMSTMHAHNPSAGPDSLGVARGYGGSIGEPERRDWTDEEYGPGAKCIDTAKPFKVAVSFPTDPEGNLLGMLLKLSQEGQSCTLDASLRDYTKGGHQPMAELTEAFRQGMTPTISYWSSSDMLWMDGLGADGRGPCVRDDPKVCPDYVRFYGFKVEKM